MQAIILAAGMGKRLKELTENNTKCMVKVDGVTLIERMLNQLDALSLQRIVIVVGYEGEKLIKYISTLSIQTPIEYVDNPIYDKTNNIYSLALAKKQLLEDDTLLLESDLIFEDSVLQELVDDPRETLSLVDKYEAWMDGTVVTLDEEDNILSFISKKRFQFENREQYYKTVNIYKFAKEFSRKYYVPFLDAYSSALGNNEYYEQVLRVITMLDMAIIRAKRLNGQKWYEIDDMQDLDIATSMFCPLAKERLALMQERYGGYWRYPQLLDFCYLVNPYYPPKKMIDEMKANLYVLLTQYPSGMKVNSLLAAKFFSVKQEHIVIGNGAAELIQHLLAGEQGKVGFIRPTFEEYPNRYEREKEVVFISEREDFSYTADDVITFFEHKEVSMIVVINPDNPTGNWLSYEDVVKLAKWCESKNIKLCFDESFGDFAEESYTFIDESLLSKYPDMIVIKSISKSYGVPGVRLGVLASKNEQLISDLKKKVSIWNINSFGEFFMQIGEKYMSDYQDALVKFKEARIRMLADLKRIDSVVVYPTQANFVMVELLKNKSDLVAQKLNDRNIFIKDLTSKVNKDNRQFLRLAVRTVEDNNLLIEALKDALICD